MKRVLVYLYENELAPKGGPKGYNYNLLLGLQGIQEKEIKIEYLTGRSASSDFNQNVNAIKGEQIKNTIRIVKSICKKGAMLYGPIHKSKIDLSEYDAIHFHLTMDMYWIKDSLKDYKGKVLLTSHTPTKPSNEIFDLLSDFEKKYMKRFYKKLSKVDEYAFDRADYIIFPCEGAEEPYYHTWKGYAQIHTKYNYKFRYFPTGTVEKVARKSRKEIRQECGIPDDAFVISFVGRHNEIKGYDQLKIVAEEILNQRTDIWFLIAGKEGPLYRLENSRWVEYGWTNDPGAIVNASDLFILPNKETYFDLVFLEVLSLGQLVLASDTGGNKYFSAFQTGGICLYDNLDEAKSRILYFYSMSKEERENKREENRKIYLENFTVDQFANNYVNLLKEIV